jgi:hypothetical protein
MHQYIYIFFNFQPRQAAALPFPSNSRVSKFTGLLGGGYQDIFNEIVGQLQPVLENEDPRLMTTLKNF